MINLTQLKYFLNITDTTQDEFLLNIIDMTVARINNLCRRNINYGSQFDIIDGNGQNLIWLNNFPVERVVWIKYRKNTGTFEYDLFNDGTIENNIYIDKISGKLILLNNYILPEGISNVQIKYYAGYLDDAPDPANETPQDLKSIALMMSAEIFLKSFQDAGGEYSKRLGVEHFEHLIKEGDSQSRKHLTFKEEDYDKLLGKYKSLRV
jgi:hypothetical protein